MNQAVISNKCISIQKNDAVVAIHRLLKLGIVRKDLKIKYDGSRVLVPIHDCEVPQQFEVTEDKFETRNMPEGTRERLLRIFRNRGISEDFPENFIRLGDALIFKEQQISSFSRETLEVISDELQVDNIYVDHGVGPDNRRSPQISRIFGNGGETRHEENGIFYSFDPEKVMFSPGNVNIRIDGRDAHPQWKQVLDMFSGIGYFSLPLAKTVEDIELFASEINPKSYEFLQKNIDINHLRRKVKPLLGDCRTVLPPFKADYIIMGHFQCLEFIAAALSHSKQGTVINFHVLSSTENIQREWEQIQLRARTMGFVLDVEAQKVVKSYGPHLWHVSIWMRVATILI